MQSKLTKKIIDATSSADKDTIIWDTELKGSSPTDQAPAGYEFETILKKKKSASTKENRNGSIVKAIKNL